LYKTGILIMINLLKKLHILGVIGIVTILLPALARAQVETFPGVIDKKVKDIDVDIEKPTDGSEVKPIFNRPKDADKTVGRFTRAEFSGLTVLSESKLQEIAEPYLGRTINKGELAELQFNITKAFYDKGYILVKVITPPKSLKGNTLKIDIYEAEVGNVIIKDPNNVLNPYISQSFSDRLGSGKIFHETAAESLISDINDLQNISASLNLEPGKKFKTTDLNIFISEADEDKNFVTVDNYGSELTGRNVATAHFEKSNILHLGETFTADLRKSNNDLWSAELGGVIPIGYKNVKLEVTAIRSENEITDRLASLDASGETKSLAVALSRNFINTKDRTITYRAGLEVRNHESFLAGVLNTKDRVRQVFIDGSYLERVDGGVFYASARLSKGLDVFDGSNSGDANLTRAGDPEAYTFEPLILLNFRPALIPGVPEIDGEIKIVASGQISSDALLSSDLFVVGGYGSIRGFEVAQETGESGYQFSLEYNHNLDLHPDWQVKAGPFIDGATVYNRIAGSTEDNNMYAAGIGFEATTSLIPAGDTRFRFDVAHPIGGYTSQQVDDNRAYFSITQNF
jgi:hemolysin activation/secretion protein